MTFPNAAAVVLLCIVLYGMLHKHKIWYERSPWPKGLLVRRPAGRLLQWLLVYYPVPVSFPSLSDCTTVQMLLDVAFHGNSQAHYLCRKIYANSFHGQVAWQLRTKSEFKHGITSAILSLHVRHD